MQSTSSLISALINLGIIFFVFKFIGKALKKHKDNNQGESNKPLNPSLPADSSQNRPRTPVPIFRETAADLKGTKAIQARKVIHEESNQDAVPKNLKRCPNCGGEIPLSMMRCDICGARQQGCGIPIIIMLVLLAGIFFAMLNRADVGFREFINQIMQWLASL